MKFLERFDAARFCFLFFYLLALLILCSSIGHGLADPDYFWHLKTGELIVATGTLPALDPFSYTAAENALTHQAWLSQVIIHAIQSHLGDRFVLLFVALMASTAWYYSFQSARLFLPSPWLSLVCALLFAPAMLLVLTPRPQLFSFLFFAVFLHQLLSAKHSSSWRPLLCLPVVMVFWVNMHGAYIMGLALLLAFTLVEGAGALGNRTDGHERRFGWLAIALVACLIASLINPDGLGRLLFPFQMITFESSGLISEWQPLQLDRPLGATALVSGVLFFCLNAYRRHVPDLLELALPAILFLAGMTTMRYYPFAALTLIPFFAIAVADGALSGLLKGPLRFVARPLERLQAWRTQREERALPQDDDKAYLVHWAAAAVVLFVISPLAVLYLWSPERRDARLPVEAVEFIQANNIQGRMLNGYRIGGYLLYRLHPDRKVFIDPRADLYGDTFFKRYLTLSMAEDGWREILSEWSIDYAILQSSAPIRTALVDDGAFAEVFNDGRYAVLLRRAPRFEALIEASQSDSTLGDPEVNTLESDKNEE